VKRALFELTQIAAADAGLAGQVVLGQASGIAQPAQIGGKHVPQVHAGSEAGPSIYRTSIF